MALSWSSLRGMAGARSVPRSKGREKNADRFRPRVEPLPDRVTPAVTATFAVDGTLRVVGDALDNAVVVSRNAAGTILVNNGAVPILGGTATVANTRQIFLNGGGGNDNLSLSEANGPMPAAVISGGDGNDVLVGGSGSDFVTGGTGNDTVFLGGGDDRFVWNNGDGSDVVDGQGGQDELFFNGSDLAERFAVTDAGTGAPFHRARLTRDVGGVSMDLNGFETIDLSPQGGADTVTIDDQSATDVFDVIVDLGGATGGDGAADAVIINGTAANDDGQVASFDGVTVSALVSFFPFVQIVGSEGDIDTLIVNTLGGNDSLDASALPAGLIGLTVNGGAGNDTIVGSQGDDLINAGPADGSDTVDGQDGFDTMVFTGSDASETFDVSAVGNRAHVTRNGAVALDLGGVEVLSVNALGGSDVVTVNDQTATDLFRVNVNLASSVGGGDGQVDSVVVNGTGGADVVRTIAVSDPAAIFIKGLPPGVNITDAEATDRLTLNTLGGNDTVDTSALPADLIGLTVNLGADQQPPPRVSNVVVNGGEAQRSMVTRVQVAFDQHVRLPANAADAFRLSRQEDGAAVALAAVVDDTGSGTVVTLTFAGGAVDGASLADGRYTLTVLATQVGGSTGPLDGDGDGAAGDDFVLAGTADNRLFRLFGDATGNGVVDLLDLAMLRSTFNAAVGSPNYLAFLDADGNGVVDLVDLAAFRGRFNQSVG